MPLLKWSKAFQQLHPKYSFGIPSETIKAKTFIFNVKEIQTDNSA